MTVNAKDLWKLMDDMDHHARSILAKNTELRSMLAQVAIPTDEKPFVCRQCGIGFKTEPRLEQHLFNVHAIGQPPPLLPHEEAAA